MKNYMIAKSNYKGEIVFINYDKLDGYKISPKKLKTPGISVKSLIIIKPSFIEKVLKRKLKIKLEYYLKYLIDINDDDSTDFREALNDIERFKETIKYKYQKYLDDKYIHLLLKKITLIQKELREKAIYREFNKNYENEYEEVRHRSR